VLLVTIGLMNAMGRQYHPLRVAAGLMRGSNRDAFQALLIGYDSCS